MKTLKDLIIYDSDGDLDKVGTEFQWISPETLRQSAIEWIKELRKALEDGGFSMPEIFRPFEHIPDWRGEVMAVITWIKHFFNITEEDLNKEVIKND